jgi:peptidoglycan/xylan/chitin deacetylase (PgdA/CDA1 family)
LRIAALLAAIALALCACGGDSGSPNAIVPSPSSEAGNTPVPEATSLPALTATAAATRPPATATNAPAPTRTPEPTAVTGPARILSRGPASARQVALTFDAGADRGFTEQILDTLKQEGVTASFGLTGQWVERNQDLAARVVADGHALINHTYSHSSWTGLSTNSRALTQAERFRELDRTEAGLVALTGRSTKPFFRSPYGDQDASVQRDLGARGYAYNILWTVDSRGWMGLPSPDITARCLQLAEPGAIYVFHVGAQSQDAAALPAIIGGLRAAGYGFVTVAAFAQ